MEKLLRRTILNRNQFVNKKRRESEKTLRTVWREFNRMKQAQSKELNKFIKRERLSRREDWMLGPLAPRRDVGAQKDTYGAFDGVIAQGATLPKRELKGPRGQGYDAVGSEDKRIPGFEDGEWKGVGLEGNLVIGDRVVVVKGGVGVGRIGEVVRIARSSRQVFVKGVNKVDLVVPPQGLIQAEGRRVFEQEMPIAMSDVQLVTKVKDSKTGVVKDVVVRQVFGGAPYEQREEGSNLPRHTRYFENTDGTQTVIDWPEEDSERYYTQSCDTTRDLVEEVTYYPNLNEEMPLADGVIDELRNPHSRARKDWDDTEFMKKKMLEDARRDWFNRRSEVLSQPFWTKEYMLKMKQKEQKVPAVE